MNESRGEASDQPNGLREQVSQYDTLAEKIAAAQARLDSLAAKGTALPSEEQGMVDELLEAFSITIEELRVAGEELRQQNDELTAAYQQLGVLQQRYRDLFEFAPSGYFVTDRQGVIRQANRAASLLLGIPPNELIGKPLAVYIASGKRANFHRYANRLASAEREVKWETEMWTRHNPEQGVPVVMSGAVLHDAEPQLSGFLWLARDITALKAAQEALSIAEQQALVGRLASSLAHELGNPLQAVLGCMGLAREALTAGKVARTEDLLDVGRAELRRSARILHRLRELSRPRTGDQIERIDLNELLARVVLLTAGHCKEHHVKVRWAPDPELRPVEAEPDRLQQVFLNLILNAVDAMPHGGTLTLRTEEAGSTVRAIVSDTGVGLEQHELEHLFTPFYTTKTGGMGLGLYISKQIVDEHRGDIEIESRAGQGATFTVALPAVGARRDEASE